MTTKMTQADEALRLLAHLYADWFMHTGVRALREVYAQIRDVLYQAISQQEAYERLRSLAQTAIKTDGYPWKVYEQARDMVQQVIRAGGNAATLIVGQTDEVRYLCLTCCQDEENMSGAPFFKSKDRRPLLKPEVDGPKRTASARCQLCTQPIHPTMLVLFTFAGTAMHGKYCICGLCSRAGTAHLLDIYGCESERQQAVLPRFRRVVAPSKQQCVEWAINLCWTTYQRRFFLLMRRRASLPSSRGARTFLIGSISCW